MKYGMFDGEKSVGEIISHTMFFSFVLFLSGSAFFGIVYLCRHFFWYRISFLFFIVAVIVPMIVEEYRYKVEEDRKYERDISQN